MGFTRKQLTFDLSEFNLESIFITDFMPVASGTYVKVYLMGYMYSKSGQQSNCYDNRSLATALQLPLQDVIDAWRYWEKSGIVICHPHQNSEDFDVEFLSVREVYIENNFVSKNQKIAAATKTKKNPFHADQETFQGLIRSVEKIVGHPLKQYEYRELNDFYEHYYKDVDILLRAVDFSFNTRKINNFKAIKSLLNEWLDHHLMDIEAINAYLAKQDESHKLYKEVLRLLGQSYRMVNQAEKDLINTWVNELKIAPSDLFNFIKYFSKKTLNINFNYIDKSLRTLAEQGITTFEALELSLVHEPQKTQNTDKPPKKTSKRHQYTMEKDRTYTEDELEAMLLNKK